MARWKESCVGKMHSMLMRLEAHFGVWLPVCTFATSRCPAAAAATAAAAAAAAAVSGAEKENELEICFFCHKTTLKMLMDPNSSH